RLPMPLWLWAPGFSTPLPAQPCQQPLLVSLPAFQSVEQRAADNGHATNEAWHEQAQQPSYGRPAACPAPSKSDRSLRPDLDRQSVKQTAKVIGQVAGAGVALVRLLLQTFQTDGLQVVRDAGSKTVRWDWLMGGQLVDDFQGGVALK